GEPAAGRVGVPALRGRRSRTVDLDRVRLGRFLVAGDIDAGVAQRVRAIAADADGPGVLAVAGRNVQLVVGLVHARAVRAIHGAHDALPISGEPAAGRVGVPALRGRRSRTVDLDRVRLGRFLVAGD